MMNSYLQFARHFNPLAICEFSNETLERIFSNILDWHFTTKKFVQDVCSISGMLIKGTSRIYQGAMVNLLPTPKKSHYTFNLRDYARVIQGLLLSTPDSFKDSKKFVRLWIHEVYRVFYDRLVDSDDCNWLYSEICKTSQEDFKMDLKDVYQKYVVPEKPIEDDQVRGCVFSALTGSVSAKSVYDEVESMQTLTSKVELSLNDYNALSKKPMDLVLFRFAVEHLTKIARVLQQPQGSMLLVGVGGSGRQSLSRLAAYLCGIDVFQIEISRGYNKVNWHDDLRKLLKQCGGQGKPLIFLMTDSQIQEESFLEDISNLLNAGEVPNLFPPDEKQEIFELMRADLRASGKSTDLTPNQLFALFVEKCKTNLHILLCLSPIGNSFRVRLRKFPSLVNCCTIDWFREWPDDGLEMVASKFIGDVNISDSEKKIVVQLCKEYHKTTFRKSEEFFKILRRHNYVTPTSYLELIKTFKRLFAVQKDYVMTFRNRYLNGLDKLNFASTAVAKMQVDLAELQPQLIKTAADTEKIMHQIEIDSKQVQETRKIVQTDEAIASSKAAEAKGMKEECEADLAEAIPALESALSALDTLKQADITVLKSMKSPPPGVKLVMEAICIMKDIKPVKIPDPSGNGKKIDDYWGPSKNLLGDMKFLEGLKTYDKDNIPISIMKVIRAKYMENPEFDPEKIKNASSAAEGLCRWVRALECYDRVAKVVEPKKMALAKAEEDLKTTMASLNEKRKSLKAVEDKMKALEDNYQNMLAKKADLERQVDSVSKQLVRAEKLIGSLGDEKERWTQSAEALNQRLQYLLGDVLVGSAIVAYLGTFTKAFRDDIVDHWMTLTTEKGIQTSANVKLSTVFGDPVKIRSWILSGLPNDAFSVDNGVMLSNSSRWPLMIDPQGQANRWIKNMEKARSLQVIKLSDPDYMRILENAIQFGTPVLLENVGEELDPILEPLLLKQTFKQGGVMCIRLGDATIEFSSEFRFYMTTKLRNPHYLPELSTKVTLLNFMITPEGLEDQLLGIVIAKERPELEEKKNQLLLQGAENKKQLKEIEDKILEVLSSSQGNILEDETAIQVLSSSKVLANSINEKQAIAEKTEKEVDEIRIGYKPIATHASTLFFCITDLANIEPMYQYSLNWYISLFNRGIDSSEKSKEVPTRLANLRKYFTESLYSNVGRSLFEKDKLLFSFLLCIAILKGQNKIDPEEWRFLITGGVGVTKSKLTNPDKTWVSEKMWGDIEKLSELPAFAGLSSSVVERTAMWTEIFEASEPHTKALPGMSPSLSQVNVNGVDDLSVDDFQKLLVLRVLRPDKMVPAISEFVISHMGKFYVESMPFDLAGSYSDSTPFSPLIFVLSPGADPMNALLKFADSQGMASKIHAISLGQGQGPLAAKMISKSAAEGGWVVLQNCHLAVSWMPTLEKICEDLTDATNANFRLWLTSYPSDKFPVSLLQNGVKMTNEPPKGLRSNLLQQYSTDPINDPSFHTGCKNQDMFEKLLFALSFFHAVIQERRQFGPIGWNIPYEFTESDLRMSARQLRNFLDECDVVPYEALKYVTGQCNYGGRVTDDKDRRALMTLLEVYYTERAVIEPEYKFSPLMAYKVPGKTGYTQIVEYIKDLPLDTRPEVFSLHENANISKNNIETDTFFRSVLLTQARSDSGGGRSAEELVFEVASDFLDRMPKPFSIDEVSQKFPLSYEECMNTVLLQEVIRYKTLIELIRESLVNLKKAVKGLVVMNADLEDMYNSILSSSIPKFWLSKSYPSVKPLAGYFDDLLKRASFLKTWIDTGAPTIFWLSGFFFTQSFLTGVMQNYARKHGIPIDMLSFSYDILDYVPTEKAEEGQYIQGLYLEGARWDSHKQSLAESLPRVLFDTLPVIWLKAGDKKADEAGYDCPVYRTSARRGVLSTTGHSTNYVVSIKIPTDVPAEVWVRRGVAALLTLND